MNTTNSDKSFEKENSSNTLNLSKEKIYSNKKKKKIVLILSIIIILLILIISFLCVYFLYIKKNKTETEKEPEEETETETENGTKNKIKAVYKTTSGEKIKLLNDKNIKKEAYKIILLENNKKLRNLNNIINSEFTPDVNGDISVNIEFKKSVNNLQSLFENIIQLKRIDLTNFDMSNVINMDSMFEGCTSLEDVILTGVNTENLKSMNYLFKNCKNLKEVDLSPINSENVENMTSIFEGCENINSINISSFPNIENDALNGINSKVNIISNERISDLLNRFSLNNLNININIIIINIVSQSCEIGEKEKCKECSSLLKGNCLSCNDGYYLPIESSNRPICSSCKIEHCKKCIGTSSFVLCQECEEGFILDKNECKSINTVTTEIEKTEDTATEEPEEEDCIIGIEEKCFSCQKEKGKKKNCFECNEGFYLPTDSQDKTKCEPCKKINNCISCNGTLNLPICNKCEIGYNLTSNKCEEITCEKGENEKCLLCNTEPNKKDECFLCNDGYFIPDNALDRTKCSKCEIEGCKKCSGNLGKQKCIECENYPLYYNGEIKSCNKCKLGEGENCLTCKDNKCETCNVGYKLMPDGSCQLIDNSFMAVYNSTSTNVSTKLMCNYHTRFKLNDFTMYVDGKIAVPTIENSSFPFIIYKFNSVGLHNVKVSFKKTLSSCIGWMFGDCKDLVSVNFSKTIDTSRVTDIYNMFCCAYSLQWVDLSSFNTSNIYEMTDTFWHCDKLTSVNLSNFNTSKVRRMEGMFDYCKSLNYLDLSSFNMSRVNNTKSLFNGVSKNGTIKISNLFGEYKKLIPKGWNIIYE